MERSLCTLLEAFIMSHCVLSKTKYSFVEIGRFLSTMLSYCSPEEQVGQQQLLISHHPPPLSCCWTLRFIVRCPLLPRLLSNSLMFSGPCGLPEVNEPTLDKSQASCQSGERSAIGERTKAAQSQHLFLVCSLSSLSHPQFFLGGHHLTFMEEKK